MITTIAAVGFTFIVTLMFTIIITLLIVYLVHKKKDSTKKETISVQNQTASSIPKRDLSTKNSDVYDIPDNFVPKDEERYQRHPGGALKHIVTLLKMLLSTGILQFMKILNNSNKLNDVQITLTTINNICLIYSEIFSSLQILVCMCRISIVATTFRQLNLVCCCMHVTTDTHET